MSEREPPRILVFDSGVGGLSVAARVHEQLPIASIVYLADNAAFPYGALSESVVVERCCRLISKALEQYPCDAIVVACNTASTVALPNLRAITDVPVVGVVPAVKPAATQTKNRRIGILATPATVRRPYLDELIREFAPDCQVERVGHPGLVQWAEDLARGVPVPQCNLDGAVRKLRDAGVDTVVLGCTHYPLLLTSLKQSLPEVKFWVDSGDAIARRVVWLLAQAGKPIEAREPSRVLGTPVAEALFTGKAPAGIASYMAGLGLQPKLVTGNWPETL
ncbi:glutamate racemase [Marinobacter sp. 1_MG-2023]|uniref:glutamate racemase n=1 Tax=Marinobacter sp. 1_MG-2023 TaxID=3062627 RepID=UPI0026E33D31|nr:glutamate racemase [Marinobacter sp. 1_MG-2023]MDO6823901.1 glutamate racemase [Marinobacter sp. 1_MG-2023]